MAAEKGLDLEKIGEERGPALPGSLVFPKMDPTDRRMAPREGKNVPHSDTRYSRAIPDGHHACTADLLPSDLLTDYNLRLSFCENKPMDLSVFSCGDSSRVTVLAVVTQWQYIAIRRHMHLN